MIPLLAVLLIGLIFPVLMLLHHGPFGCVRVCCTWLAAVLWSYAEWSAAMESCWRAARLERKRRMLEHLRDARIEVWR